MRSGIREELRGGCQTAEGAKSSEHPQNQQPIVGSTIMTLPNTKNVSYDTCENSYAISSLPLSASQLLGRLASTSRPDSEWAFELIKRGPIEGANGGCHGWLYQAARALYLYRHRHGFAEQEMFTLLRAKADGYGRRVPDNEINDALESAIRHAGNPNSKQQTRQTCWPEPDFERADAIVKVGFGLKDLQESSPVNLARNPTSSAQVVSCLFTHLPGTNDPLICASPFSNTRRTDAGELITKPLSKWMSEEEFSGWWRQEKLRQQSFIVPSPMTKILSAKDGGEYSPR
jgi:hypothetical protein